jgi:hypothetical protein
MVRITRGPRNIRDTSAALRISVTKVLKVPSSGKHKIKPKQNRYGCLETDEFWTYAGKKKNKARLMYAYDRETGEMAVPILRFAVWGKRDLKTAKRLRKRLKRLGISCCSGSGRRWEPFSFGFCGRQPHGRERARSRDRGEPLPVKAQDTESVSEDLLLFQEVVQPPKSV